MEKINKAYEKFLRFLWRTRMRSRGQKFMHKQAVRSEWHRKDVASFKRAQKHRKGARRD